MKAKNGVNFQQHKRKISAKTTLLQMKMFKNNSNSTSMAAKF